MRCAENMKDIPYIGQAKERRPKGRLSKRWKENVSLDLENILKVKLGVMHH